ncbi:MAG: carboxypeptidase [Desulfobacula sp. GWF2_41_7]|nr:MAG: carboxypeptidase [Desulfobacula sp. GWF2_41_7]
MNLFLRVSAIVRFCFFMGLILISIGSLSGMFLVFHITKDLPKLPAPLSKMIEIPQTQIYASNGKVLISLGERQAVSLGMVSKNFINAILATEDHLFFKHRGVNKLRTLKALYVTLTSQSGKVEGASTITQQLAKNLFFSFERTLSRKLKELLVSFQIEASNTKEEILQTYINQIHFGAGAQGVEKAAQVFFGKSALNLTLPEAALLAGLPKSPTNYNPFRHYDLALKRRDIVLTRMTKAGFISETEAREAAMTKPVFHRQQSDSRTGSYFLDAMISELISKYGEDVVYHGGIRVYATIDTKLQSYAQQALKKGLENLDNMMGITDNGVDHPQGALVAIDTGSGAVKAMIGGRDYYESEFNRATKSRRQPGSGFKPFLYYTALKDLGFHPATVLTDKPVIIPVKGAAAWEPRNFSKTFTGQMILKKALTESVNTIAAQMVEKAGPDAVIRTARTCGIESPLQEVYSVALGTSNVTPYEMAAAYSVFATLGVMHEPFLFWRVEDAYGRILYEHIVQEKRVLDPSITYQLVDMMKSVIDIGSGKSIRALGFNRAAAGKTGTTDSFNDAWFTGFTPTLCTSVWTGFDKEKKLLDSHNVGITGGRGAAPIWADFMINALNSDPERDFPIPDNVHFEAVDTVTGCAPEESTGGRERMMVPLKTEQQLCRDKQQ